MFAFFGGSGNSTPIGPAGGVLGGNFPNPVFASNGTSHILDTVQTHLATPVTMTSANTYFDGPGITLTTGKWWVDGHVQLQNATNANVNFTAKLWDGVTVFDSTEMDAPIQYVKELTLGWVITIVGNVTVKISACSTVLGGIISIAAVTNGAGNNASMIRALRIG